MCTKCIITAVLGLLKSLHTNSDLKHDKPAAQCNQGVEKYLLR